MCDGPYRTERPVTLDGGANRLVQPRRDAVIEAVDAALASAAAPLRPELWDGRASLRIVDVLQRLGVLPRQHHVTLGAVLP